MKNRPGATYRLQFHKGFGFGAAEDITGYLRELGVTHVYASPYFKAVAGSTHGYDVIDHNQLNPELGTREAYEAWVESLKRVGMGQILDIVPNHVGVATNENLWWNDVLKRGRASSFAGYFDIAWDAGGKAGEEGGKLLLPVLGAPYGEVLEKGELKVVKEQGEWFVRYCERRFPLSEESAARVERQGSGAFDVSERDSACADALDALLLEQHYRLAYWRVAAEEINYRRFFDINDLAALAMEREEVFEATHRLLLELIRSGKVAGVRVDHPDGLYDPGEYFARLRREVPGLYVVIEKILGPEEELPGGTGGWEVDGTSGYDFVAHVNGLFVDGAGEEAMGRVYREFVGREMDYRELVYRNKRLILEKSLASELRMLSLEAQWLAGRDRHWRDFTLRSLREALREVIACFPVYRSYVTDAGAREEDRKLMAAAIQEARRRNPDMVGEVFAFLGDMVLQRSPRCFGDDERRRQRRFAAKFQQLTAPVTAKGIEDTTFYQYCRLVSLNEVGGEPGAFGIAPDKVHGYFAQRQRRWPYALSPLSTHDTKRSEDVRARINVLSEMPETWGRAVGEWREMNRRLREAHASGLDANDEYLLYQTLVRAWPREGGVTQEFVTRIQAYMRKAVREAKVHSSWTDPNGGYEKGMEAFVAGILSQGDFVRRVEGFQRIVAPAGAVNSLSQTLLRLTAPGVPDTYQGTELFDLSLVDPDNRRPVDYGRRRALLETLKRTRDGGDWAGGVERWGREPGDEAKLLVTWRGMQVRKEMQELFTRGRYVPLAVEGGVAERVFAFAREWEGRWAVVATPRLVGKYPGEGWESLRVVLPLEARGRDYRNEFTGERVRAGETIAAQELFGRFPVALLIS